MRCQLIGKISDNPLATLLLTSNGNTDTFHISPTNKVKSNYNTGLRRTGARRQEHIVGFITLLIALPFQLSHGIHKTRTAREIMSTANHIVRIITFRFQLVHGPVHSRRRILGTYQLTLCPTQSIEQGIALLAQEPFFYSLYAQVTFPTILCTHQSHSTVMIALNTATSYNGIVTILTQELFIGYSLTSLASTAHEGKYIITNNLYRLFANDIVVLN